MRVLMIHGRAQGGKDPSELKKNWLATLEIGLAGHGKPPLNAKTVDFPFYGDLLDELTAKASLPTPADVVAKGPGQNAEFEQFQRSVLMEMKKEMRISDEEVAALLPAGAPQEKGPENWAWVQAIVRLLDRHLTPISDMTIENFLKDVFLYLTRPNITKRIDRTVEAMLSDEPTLVVSHSLGTVVAFNVLRRHKAKLKLTKFITLGSPLGITAISSKLGVIENPAAAVGWYNAYDERDIVALNPLDSSYFPVNPSVMNYNAVKNHTENRHGIAGYLNDPSVTATVMAAMK
ncbi:serine peptidase [Bosea sp. WAO]|uniref:serine peptidase n=1 Tax=Bosea sp. WAO TaxID=406341 RepID=UPI00074B0848|nr:serine peptidase [Bosea sp. WAO]KUL96634.1 serine peptidase [Bosea sp. WAO]